MKTKISLLILLLFTISCTEDISKKGLATPPEWSYNKTIYEINIRQYSEAGTFDAIRKDLPRLKELGVGILWLMPIHPIGEVNRKGTLGSYYSVKDYFDVNKEFGTKEDFRKLVDEAHDMGFFVILDWVANHTAWDNPITITNPDFFVKDENGNFVPPHGTDWTDVIQLDYENQELWDFMIKALTYWVEEFNIDGYRCDVADMVPVEFWNRARRELDEIKPVFMLAEAETPALHDHAFDMSYSWKMHHLFNTIATDESMVSSIDQYLDEDRKLFPDNAFRMQFTSNHDENSWNGTEFERLGEAVKAFAVLKFTIEGMPLVYNGQEAGFNRRLDFFEKDLIDWGNNEYFTFYKKLIALKSTHPALQNGNRGGSMQKLYTSDASVYAFARTHNDNTVLTVLNLSSQSSEFALTNPQYFGRYEDVFDDSQTQLINVNNNTWLLDPWGYKVFYR